MPTTQYFVYIGEPGTPSGSLDYSPDVLALRWRLGLAQPGNLIAAPGMLEITLRNPERDYSPEVAPNALPVGALVRVMCQPDGEPLPITHFTGFIREVLPSPGAFSERTTLVRVSGPEPDYAALMVLMPLQIGVRADEVLAELFTRIPLDTRIPTDFAGGIAVLSYVGDLWGDGVPAARVIREVVEAERGHFYTNRTGEAVFRNRHGLLQTGSPALTLTDDLTDLRYVYGANLINTVRIKVRPRTVGLPGTTLWTLANAQLIRPGATKVRRIVARFYDASGQRIGAQTLIAPEAYTDYTANTAPDGSGVDVTAALVVTAELISGGAVRLTIQNNTGSGVYLLPGTRVRGTPIYPGDSVLVVAEDPAAQAQYGVRTLNLALPALDSLEDAYQMAEYELARNLSPRGEVLTITLDERHDSFTAALALTLFDRVRVIETQTGHQADYALVAEEHTVTDGGYRHQITWTLEPLPSLRYWQLNVSAFNADTRLGY